MVCPILGHKLEKRLSQNQAIPLNKKKSLFLCCECVGKSYPDPHKYVNDKRLAFTQRFPATMAGLYAEASCSWTPCDANAFS